ncbi:regulatory-associated protein of mTOR isoform X1 [Tribolium castaneum]|uniref:Regulatory-associated protein of mTOR-like Protein n=1 Tax=Tribolium castaneum TaxID=7070 RepID=D6WXI0_TRICA|nr:PREDICTED: regulatory-associated protein of mTOR isoform X1 [Tribolium castaneum]EFA08847.1 Regulatory-associated protein of mTOR-like Protein [Tribolium castaneum]|eukprot:XP_969794.1 PREDICTED: regulatory-associated protein of mTOR isoform X1 [Tribolium castaneum]
MTELGVNGNDEKDSDKEAVSDKDLPLSFMQDRHLEPIEGVECITQTWRMKERMKTVSVALVLCLNVGVDPPDVMKTQPCARLECWIDPLTLSAPKSIQKIGENLQAQYERWQPRARYKQSLDPTSEEVKKLCTSLRRNAKEERVLFHYNGHGVPKPTENGEIWVFNRTYTQYIPLSIYDLQTWMGAPSIYVYDCSNAGIIIESFERFAAQHEAEYEQATSQSRQNPVVAPLPSYKSCIQLAACGAKEVLPMNPDLPADLFTSCLTTPIKVALRWFVLQSTSKLVPKVTLDLIDKIPGQITDRRTMLGELNWIFTAITDTIAWNTLQRDLFQKLFRQDLLVASLFRNFLLAERILKSCDCTPVSSPLLPPTSQHPMWNAWDLALDLSLGQLPGIINRNEPFQNLPFFEEQLTAFQVWLELGCEERSPPEQLPIVLQVLLSQVHRMRALELLGRFLDLGPWAVNLALSVGIFPYVLKLLQSSAKELRPLLVFIWAKILAVDNTCQGDLVRDSGHKYFLSVLQDTSLSSEYRTQSAFVLASIVNNFHDGQEAALKGSLVSICLEQLNDPSSQLRQWVAICLGKLWDHYENARWTGVRDIAHEKLYKLLNDPCPEVRAAAVYALGTFINSVTERSEHANNIDHAIVMTLVKKVSNDMSHLVRKELVNALQWVVLAFEHVFITLSMKEILSHYPLQEVNVTSPGLRRIGSRDRLRTSEDSVDKMKRVSSSSSINNMGQMKGSLSHTGSLGTLPGLGYGSIYMKIWDALCSLETDPHPEVESMCKTITKYIANKVKESREFVDNKCASLPPSPNRGNYLSGESPPTLHPATDIPKYTPRGRKIHPNIINEETDMKIKQRKALVSTKFIEWSCKRFAQSKRKSGFDVESPQFYERDWRYTRNNNIRREALDETSRILSSKLESQLFNTRTSLPPSVLQFHPFDQQIAVAGKDHFGIWDWGTGAKTTVCHNKSAKAGSSRITSLEWINAHDVAMLMVASDDGSVKVWKPNTGHSREPTLISAWQALNDLKWKYSGTLLAWEQYTQTCIAAGDSRIVRFWDVEKELFAYDIMTGADCAITCIDSTFSGVSHENYSKAYLDREKDDEGISIDEDFKWTRYGMVVAGFQDGSIRVFDRRCSPTEARIAVFMEHSGPILGVHLLGNTFYSGSTDGHVRVFDVRNHRVVHTTQAIQNNMSCFALHRGTATYACGSLNQNVSIYGFNGCLLNTIKFYEGFMGHRTGNVTCLNYHPLKVALATGTSDCSVSVYCLEGKR